MRVIRTLACVLAAFVMVACDCFVPTSPSLVTPDPAEPTAVSLSVQGAASVRVGETTPWLAVVQFSDGSRQTVTQDATWSSSAPGSASVSDAGVVAGIAVGQSTIQATHSGLSGSGTITIVARDAEAPTVVSLAIEGNTATRVGQSTPLQAVARLSDGTSQTVTALASWTSDAPLVATVSGGTVAGIAVGQAPVRASYGGQQASATVTVSASTPEAPVVVSIAISGGTTVQVGQTTQLQAIASFSNGTTQNVTNTASWSSGAANIATVSNGLVAGIAAGSSPIQASFEGKVGSTTVTVTQGSTPTPTVQSLSIQGANTVQAGQTVQLQAIAQLSNGSTQNVTSAAAWTSASPANATVAAGLVSGVAAGTANITASYSGASAQTTMTVTAAPVVPTLIGIEVTATIDLTQVLLNQPITLQVMGVYSDGSRQDVTSAAVLSPQGPGITVGGSGPGTLLVTQTLVDALLDPNHTVNVQYGGFSESVNIVLKLPGVQAVQLGTGGVTSLALGSQLPALQTVFTDGASASLGSDFPGVTWSTEPRGALGGVLSLLGLNLNQVLSVSNGRLTTVSNTLLNTVTGLLPGGIIPLDMRATYDGVQSNVLQVNAN